MWHLRFTSVLWAINAIGRDDRHYTLFMLRNGEVIARRYGNHGQGPYDRIKLKRFVHPDFRTEETLRYIADLKGFIAL